MTEDERENSLELQQFIIKCEKILESEELLYAIDTRLHSQLDHITFNPETNEYNMWDKEGTHFYFKALNFGEKRNNYIKSKKNYKMN